MEIKMIIARFVGTVLGVSLCFLPAFANVTLPFSTTYDCAEQAQHPGGWVNCDGILSDGDWTTTNGGLERITSAANYSGGGGGRGQRHAIGHTTNNTNGSGGTRIEFPREQEIYIRYYTRWEQGLKLGNPLREEKIIYLVGGYCGNANGCHIDIQGNSFRIVVQGNPYPQSGGGTGGWDTLFGGSDAASDGRWIRLEFHLKNGSGSTGVFQAWVDGVLTTNVSNVSYNSTGFTGFEFPSNHQFRTVGGPATDQWQDMDDLAVRTTGPIGAIGGPVAPANLKVLQ